jgi:hypothetical protein
MHVGRLEHHLLGRERGACGAPEGGDGSGCANSDRTTAVERRISWHQHPPTAEEYRPFAAKLRRTASRSAVNVRSSTADVTYGQTP